MARVNPPPTNLAILSQDGRIAQVWADWFYRLATNVSQAAQVTTVTGGGTTTLLAGPDRFVYVDTTLGNTVIILPPSDYSGQEIEVNYQTGSNRLDIQPTGSDLIIGQTLVQVYVRRTSLRFKAASGEWVII